MSTAERENFVTGWNLSSNQSPVYASIKDAIPYSSGSPKYAEIDESGVPKIIPRSSEMKIADEENSAKSKINFPSWHLENDYCSLLTPSESQTSTFSTKIKAVTKKPSLNRRRSKSMEDIYAVPSRAESLFERRMFACFDEESLSERSCDPPPVPDRNFSPQSLFQSFISLRSKRTAPVGLSGVMNRSPVSPSLMSVKESPQKRHSQEGSEVGIKKSPTKKVRAEASLQVDTHEREIIQDCFDDAALSTNKNFSYCKPETPKLSILTGSLKPTTRSAKKAFATSDLSDSESKKNSNQEDNLGLLEVKQLEESPKFPRRQLKRRSSSFSITPGKRLTFGKSSKMATPSPRRVSFAKDVKDTDSKSTPPRRSSTRRIIMPAAGGCVTRQTQENLNFQSFLSSHSSPPNKGKVKETNLSKPPSPLKTSLTNLLSNLKKKSSEDNDVDVNSVGNNRTLLGGYSFGKKSSVEGKSLSHQNLENNGNIFPPSPTKQLGRRVLGYPMKQSSNMSESHQSSQFSPDRKCAKLKQGTALPIRKKPIHAFMTKLSSKTSVLCAEEVIDSDDFSSNDDLANHRSRFEPFKGSTHFDAPCLPPHSSISLPANQLYILEGEREHRQNTEQVNSRTSELKMTSPRSFTDDQVLRFDMTSGESDEFMPHVKLDQWFEEHSRAGEVKAFARVAKIWNRTLGFDATVDPFIRKIIPSSQVNDNTIANCEDKRIKSDFVNTTHNKQWSHKTNCSTNENHSLNKTETGMKVSCLNNIEVQNKKSQFSARYDNTSEISNSTPNVRQILSTSTGSDFDNHKNQAQSDNSSTVYHLTMGPHPAEENTKISSNSENSTDLSITLTSNLKDEQKVQEVQNIDTVSSPDLPIVDVPSFTLPPYPELTELSSDDGSLSPTHFDNVTGPAFSLSKSDLTVASSSHFPGPCKTDQSFILPPYPEERITNRNLAFALKETSSRTDSITSQPETCPPLPSSSEAPPPLVGNENDEFMKDSQISVCLQRIKSLKSASPKVVENDSWITERRHSNRHNKRQNSIRSAFNQSLTPVKYYENIEEPSEAVCDHTSEGLSSFVKIPDKPTINFSEIFPTESASTPSAVTADAVSSPQIQTFSQASNLSMHKVLKFKPEILPKTSKAITFAQKRLNVQNFINSHISKSRPVPKRRSSLTKEQSSKTKQTPRGDFITKNINAVKKEATKSTANAMLANPATPKHTEKAAQDIVIKANESKTSSKGRRSGSNSEHPHNISDSNKLFMFNQLDKIPRKKGSSISQDRRRRSKSHGVEEENHLTFSERRKFFQQLQASKPRSPMKSLRSDTENNTPHRSTHFDKLSEPKTQLGSRTTSKLMTTPKSLRPQTQPRNEQNNSRQSALSPNCDLHI